MCEASSEARKTIAAATSLGLGDHAPAAPPRRPRGGLASGIVLFGHPGLIQRRPRHPRRHRVDPHPVRGQLQRGAPGQRQQRPLGGAVDAHLLDPDRGQPRGDVDDRPSPVGPHRRRRLLQHRQRGEEVDLEDLARLRHRHRDQLAGVVEGGVVDEHVEPPVRAERRLDDPGRRPGLGQVGGEEGDPLAFVGEGRRRARRRDRWRAPWRPRGRAGARSRRRSRRSPR